MNKQEFLAELQNELCGLPQDEIQRTLEFYSEIIDDRIEYCLSEEIAVATVGNVQNIANEILKDIPLSKLVKEKVKPSRTLRVWEIVLLVLGSPIWLSLLIAAVAVVLSAYVSLWAVIISLYAVAFSLAACGIAGVLALPIFVFRGCMIQGIFIIGCGLVCAGLSIFLFYGCKAATKGILALTKLMALGIKRCFVKKEASK